MAIWEVRFFIVKEEKIKLFKNIPDINSVFEEIILWGCYKEILVKDIENVLKVTKSWSDNIKQYGDSNGTKLEFYYENDLLLEILCNVNVRYIKLQQVEAIVKFISINKGLIFYNNEFYTASVECVKNIILTSDAFKFCKNPRKYIENYHNQ